MKVAFIINSSRKLNPASDETIRLAKLDAELDCHFFFTEKAKQSIQLAKQVSDSGFQAVIAVGGDGTCNEVLNGIQLSMNKSAILFGIVPNGTGNDFQKMVGEFQPDIFIASIKNQRHKQIDICKVQLNDSISYALNIAGIGFDGYVVQQLEIMRTNIRLHGKIAYALAILQSFMYFKKRSVQIQCAEFNYEGKLMLMAVCNGRAFGHGLFINPEAKMDDGKLNVTLLGEVTFWDYIQNIGRLKKGLKINHPNVHYFQTEEIRINIQSQTLYTELDGENIGSGNVNFTIEKGVLKLLI
ncbi:MAG: diacylglycerol kinase family protein [Crocinitomicaceae bacterium]